MKNPQRSGPHKLKGGEIWNKLPISIKNSKSLEIFKKKIKKYYLDLRD